MNQINKLLDQNEEMTIDQEQMGMIFSSYYSQLFSSSNPSNIDLCLIHLQPMVSDSMNASLLANITKNEIKATVF